MSKGGGQGSFAQMQEPGLDMGGFGSGPRQQPFNDQIVRIDNQRETNIQPMPMPLMQNQGPDNIGGGLGSKGGRSSPYQTDGIVPPNMGGGRVFAGGTPYFNEGTGEFTKTPRGPVKLQPIKMQPLPFEPVLSDGPDFRPPPEDIESRGTVGPGGGTGGRGGRFRDGIRDFIDEFRPQPMPRRQPPIFGPPRNFPFPMPKPPRMPPRQPPRMPGRNTQFQMPFFGSQYGRMNPYQRQFSGYGVPSNIYGFDQPHYQPYVPPPPAQSAPPVMQLPPGQGGNQVFSGAPVAYTPPAPVAFGGGFGGIGGFGRYNLGLAGRQFRGR